MFNQTVISLKMKKRQKKRNEIIYFLNKAKDITNNNGDLRQALKYVNKSFTVIESLIEDNFKHPSRSEIDILKDAATIASNFKSYLEKKILQDI